MDEEAITVGGIVYEVRPMLAELRSLEAPDQPRAVRDMSEKCQEILRAIYNEQHPDGNS